MTKSLEQGTGPVASSPRPWGWTAAGACALLVAGSVGLGIARGVAPDSLGLITLVLAYALVGAVILMRRPGHLFGRLFLAIALAEGLAMFGGNYARWGFASEPAAPLAWVGAWLNDWTWFLGYATMLTYVPLLFPDGKPPSNRWRPVVWAAALPLVLMTLTGILVLPARLNATTVGAPVQGAELSEALGPIAFASALAIAPICLAALVVRFRRAQGEVRQQMKWFVYSLVVTIAALLALGTLGEVGDSAWLAEGVRLLAATALPVGAGIAIVRHRLFDVDVVINRTLVYVTLTALIAASYVALVVGADALTDEAGLFPSVLAAVAVAVAFGPLRVRVQQGVDRLMYGRRADPYGVLSELGRRLDHVHSVDDMLPVFVETVASMLRLPFVRVEVRDEGAVLVDAVAGAPTGPIEQWPLKRGEHTVGILEVGRRAPAEEFSRQDMSLLGDVSRQASGAATSVLLSAGVQRSRQELRNSLEEERRRIRRDLHDGLGPSLAAVVLGIERARRSYGRHQENAEAVLEDVKHQVQDSIGEVRALIYGLRPASLDELGLVGALRQEVEGIAANGGNGRPASVELDAPEHLPSLPAAVEVAAYRIATEALTNVVKHARAGRCSVRLWLDDALHLEVADDGVGIAPDAPTGIGTASIRARAVELGGSARIESSREGTTVRADLPVELP